MTNEFYKLGTLIKRHIKLYFKDKVTFFVSLITPLILVVLFLTFLQGVYENSLLSMMPEGINVSQSAINAFTGGWLFSSIIAVSSVTVAFCCNMMVLDKVSKSVQDFQIAPVRTSTLNTSYFIANFITTLIICLIVFVISMLYLTVVGFYLSLLDVLMLLVSTFISVLFGCLLASVIGLFISSQGAQTGVSVLISSMYGFICGAYMPISQFGTGIQTLVSLLPGTYGTVLFRQFYMRGVVNHLQNTHHLPDEFADTLLSSFDGKFTAFGTTVPTWAMFVIMIGTTTLLFGLYLLISKLGKNKKVR